MNSMVFKKKAPLMIFLVPSFLFLAVFLLYPFIINIYNSFYHISIMGAKPGKFNNLIN